MEHTNTNGIETKIFFSILLFYSTYSYIRRKIQKIKKKITKKFHLKSFHNGHLTLNSFYILQKIPFIMDLNFIFLMNIKFSERIVLILVNSR